MGLVDVLSPLQVPSQGSPLGFVSLVVQSGSSVISPPEVTRGEGFLSHSGGSHRASTGPFPGEQEAGAIPTTFPWP